MKILVNAGPTREKIDPVRFISNHSSGKMGYAIAEAAILMGYEVTLVSGPVSISAPENLHKFISIESAAEMAEAMKKEFFNADLTILCAAVADYRPARPEKQKMKKKEGNLFLELERTEDIALSLGSRKKAGQLLAGFAAETNDLEANALTKMRKKNFDFIAANAVGIPGRGFGAEENAITLYKADGTKKELTLKSKKELAKELLEELLKR
ncbi:MAG: phosphopantothenoylcysteine decarboxylase [Lentisphaeria bacterium]|nr:phosphopantothenoylcysteine decarboxylase [Lentisphaeria bacterium]